MGALLAAWARAMSREHHQPTEPPHPRCGAHWDPAARAASATQPPPGTHSLARRPGAEGGRGQRRERERRKTRRDGGPGSGEEEGSPALRESVSQINPEIKLFQFKHLLLSPPFPTSAPALRKVGLSDSDAESQADGERPRRHSLVPCHRWLQKRRRPRSLPGPGRIAIETKSQNKQLKMAATPLRHPPLSGTAPSSLRLRALGPHHLRRNGGGEETGRGQHRHGYPTGKREEQERLRTGLQKWNL